MSLDDITAEAVKAGLKNNEIETAKRQYFFGIMHYQDRNPEPNYSRFGSAILAMMHHERMSQYCGKAYARKYIRETAERNKE